MNLYLVQWFYGHALTGQEHVWADSEREALRWGSKHCDSRDETRVTWVHAASTTEDKPTPPGLDTYLVKQGERL